VLIERFQIMSSNAGPQEKRVNDSTSQLPVFERISLLHRVLDDPELMYSVLETFLEDIPVRMQALEQALHDQD